MTASQFVKRPLFGLALVLLLGFLAGAYQNAAYAQTSGVDKPIEGATPGGVNDGSSSDAELWRQIRSGESGTVVGGDKSGGLMIQSGGQDWRLMRNGPLPRYIAWAILGTLFLLSIFFALRGRVKIDSGLSGETIKRFSAIERTGHWLLASSFIVLALTGLNLIFGKTLLIPLLGKEAFASMTVFGKYIHNYVGFAFMLGLAMVAVMWVMHNIPNWSDVKWLARGGGMLGGGHPPAKKFNAGQKIIFWVVILCGVSISMSGWALMNPFSTQMFAGTFGLSNSIFGTAFATDLAPIQEQQYQSLWHTIMATIMIVVVLAHIYIGTIGMEGALSAMTSGDVDTNWAREHHSLWVDEEETKGAGAHTTAPVAAAAAVPGAVIAAKVPTTSSAAAPETQSEKTAKATAAKKTTAKPKPALVAPKKVKSTTKAVKAEPKAASSKSTVAANSSPKSKSTTNKKSVAPKSPASSKSRAKDDLKLIKGIGPQNEQRLNKIGVKLFDDVAKWTKKEQADIGQRLAFPGRIEREEWVKQAKALAKKATRN